MCSNTAAMDWPLSRAEKRHQVMQLYDKEEQMGNDMLVSGQAALARMKAEIEMIKNKSRALANEQQGLSEDSQRLWQALEAASAVFRAVVPASVEDECSGDEGAADVRRTKSAGALRTTSSKAPEKPSAVSKKPRTPRSSLKGKERRVSFGTETEDVSRLSVVSKAETVCEPEPEESLSEPVEAEFRLGHLLSGKILDWGLTEFTAPVEAEKLGIGFKKLPPTPVVILKVTEGSWAHSQGIEVEDVLHSVDGKRVEHLQAQQFIRLIAMKRPLKLTIERLPMKDDRKPTIDVDD